MPRTRPPYPLEFRRRMVELVRAGRSPEELAQKFEPSAAAIRNWVVQADRDAGQRADGVTTEEREELRRLRRENRVLREEREILRNCRARHRPSHLLREKLAGASMLVSAREAVAVSFMVPSRARSETWSGGGLRT